MCGLILNSTAEGYSGLKTDQVRQRTDISARTMDNFDTMLVTFTTKTYADITMFGDIALALLKKMGHSTTVPGAILAADVPAALGRLTAAIDAEKAVPPVTDSDEDSDEEEPAISMAHRALPLIELLAAAAKADANVMWK